MQNQMVFPYNANMHMILGCATDVADEPEVTKLWAQYMVGNANTPAMKIRDAWYQAGIVGYKNVASQVSLPNPTIFAVAADGNCSEDSLQTNSSPTAGGGKWTYYNTKQVYPPQ